MADASLIFDTKIDADGFVQGLKGLSSKTIDLKNKIHDTEGQIKSLRAELEKMANTPIKSDAAKNLEKEISKVQEKLRETDSQLSSMMSQKVESNMSLGFSRDEAIKAAETSLSVDAQYQKLTQAAENYDAKLQRLQASLKQVNAAQAGIKGSDTSEYQKKQAELESLNGKLEQYKAKLNETEQAEAAAASKTSDAASATQHYKETLKAAKSGLDSFSAQVKKTYSKLTGVITRAFKRVFISGLVFKAMRSVLSGISEGLEEIAKVNPAVNASLSELSSSFSYLKNSLSAALTPLIQTVTPYLVQFMDTVSAVIDKVGQMIAALTGNKNYTKAIKQQKDYAASLDASTKSAKANTKALRENERGLASFDELNVLQDSSSNESEVAADTANNAFQMAEVSLDDLINKIKEKLNGLVKWFFNDSPISGLLNTFIQRYGSRILEYTSKVKENLESGAGNFVTYSKEIASLWDKAYEENKPELENAATQLLGGTATLGLSIGYIDSSAFDIWSQSLVDWVNGDGATIQEFFSNLQLMAADIMSTVGMIFEDIGTTLISWWDESGADTFQKICDAFNDVKTTLMNLWNKWVKPIWDAVVDIVQDAWENCLQPIFEKLLGLFSKIGEMLSTLWTNIISPLVNKIVDVVAPLIKNVFEKFIKPVFHDFFNTVKNVVSHIIDALGGLLDFFTGLFSGDLEKAMSGLFDFASGLINSIIDLINGLISGIYTGVISIANTIGGLIKDIGSNFGLEWGWEIPSLPPQISHVNMQLSAPSHGGSSGRIPAYATGTVVPAHFGEYLAVLGDNKREPEVVSPLSTMKQALAEVLSERGGDTKDIHLTVNLDSRPVFDKMVSLNGEYIKSHGYSAFAKG